MPSALIFGIVWSVIWGIVIGLVKVLTGFSVYAIMINKIFPFGACFTGLILFCGYYFKVKLSQNKFTLTENLINLTIMCVITFLLINYVPYYMQEVNGIKVRQVISFWEYFDLTVKNTSVSLGINSGPYYKLGAFWGYVYALLKVVGYLSCSIVLFVFQDRDDKRKQKI